MENDRGFSPKELLEQAERNTTVQCGMLMNAVDLDLKSKTNDSVKKDTVNMTITRSTVCSRSISVPVISCFLEFRHNSSSGAGRLWSSAEQPSLSAAITSRCTMCHTCSPPKFRWENYSVHFIKEPNMLLEDIILPAGYLQAFPLGHPVPEGWTLMNGENGTLDLSSYDPSSGIQPGKVGLIMYDWPTFQKEHPGYDEDCFFGRKKYEFAK